MLSQQSHYVGRGWSAWPLLTAPPTSTPRPSWPACPAETPPGPGSSADSGAQEHWPSVTIPVCICEQEHGVQPGQEAGVLHPGRAAARVAAQQSAAGGVRPAADQQGKPSWNYCECKPCTAIGSDEVIHCQHYYTSEIDIVVVAVRHIVQC